MKSQLYVLAFLASAAIHFTRHDNYLQWCISVILLSVFKLMDSNDPVIFVLLGKALGSTQPHSDLPDAFTYPIDCAMMALSWFAHRHMEHKRRPNKSIELMYLFAGAATAIVQSKHSDYMQQSPEISLVRVAMYLACAAMTNGKAWTAVAQSVWILNVHYIMLAFVCLQLNLYVAPKLKERQAKASLVITDKGPMLV
tara:strand:- start:1174 stop:1764 length:591 start_codon:yes stop_codon:yes gene_type:complete